jgi:CheY-like chemotaxis protein
LRLDLHKDLQPQSEKSDKNSKILIVEDEKLLAYVIQLALEVEGNPRTRSMPNNSPSAVATRDCCHCPKTPGRSLQLVNQCSLGGEGGQTFDARKIMNRSTPNTLKFKSNFNLILAGSDRWSVRWGGNRSVG